MGTLDTKLLIADALVELCNEQPLKKVSISDIVERTGKNRKTFYYHFEGKESLIRWIFRRDLADVLNQRIPPEELVYEAEGPQTYPTLPYYVCRKVGVRSLNGSVFLEMLATCFSQRRQFYAKILRISGPDSLQTYLKQLYTTALAQDVRFTLSNRYLDEGNIRFLSEFYAGAIVTYIVDKVCDPTCQEILADVKPFQNIVHSSLESEIKKQQLKRVL